MCARIQPSAIHPSAALQNAIFSLKIICFHNWNEKNHPFMHQSSGSFHCEFIGRVFCSIYSRLSSLLLFIHWTMHYTAPQHGPKSVSRFVFCFLSPQFLYCNLINIIWVAICFPSNWHLWEFICNRWTILMWYCIYGKATHSYRDRAAVVCFTKLNRNEQTPFNMRSCAFEPFWLANGIENYSIFWDGNWKISWCVWSTQLPRKHSNGIVSVNTLIRMVMVVFCAGAKVPLMRCESTLKSKRNYADRPWLRCVHKSMLISFIVRLHLDSWSVCVCMGF